MGVNKIATALPTNLKTNFARLNNIYTPAAIVIGALAGYTVFFVNQPVYVLLALGGIGVFLLSLFYEEFGLLVLVFFSYTRFSDVLIEYEGFISIAKPFVVLLIVAILLRWAVYRDPPKGWLRPVLLFGLLSLTGLVSLFYSPVADRVEARLLNDIKDALIAVIVVILLQRGTAFRRVMWVMILVGFFLGTLTVFQYFSGTFDKVYGGFAVSMQHQIVGGIDDYRATGPVGDPNFFAEIMVVLAPIALERFFHEKKALLRGAALWTFAVSVLSVIFSYSRGGLIALVFGLLVFFLYYPPKKFQIPVTIIALAVFILFLPPYYMERLSTLTEIFHMGPTTRVEERSLQGRLSENLTALEMIKTHPLFGVGLNSFSYLFPQYSKKLGLALVATEREAHNLYLEVAAETGIVGFSVFLFVLLSCFLSIFQARRKFKQANMEDYAQLTTGFMAGWLAYLVAAGFIHNAFPRYFYLLMGIALALRMVLENTIQSSNEVEQA